MVLPTAKMRQINRLEKDTNNNDIKVNSKSNDNNNGSASDQSPRSQLYVLPISPV